MALFTRRDRIAIAVIALLILLGWGVRFGMKAGNAPDDFRVIRNAVEVPALLNAPDTLSAYDHGLLKELTVDINKADKSEFESLPSIGQSRAAAIIAYRKEHGPFRKPEDIMNVPGIGPGIFRSIKNHITISGNKEK